MNGYLIDTSVLSEPLAKKPNQAVLTWMKSHETHSYISAITVQEMTNGVAALPEGKRKRILKTGVEAALASFGARTIAYDKEEARAAGQMQAEAESRGINIDLEDIIIAATAKVHGLTVATRNAKHFALLEMEVLNPFDL